MLRSLLKPLALVSALALSGGMASAVTLEQQGSSIFGNNGSRNGTITPGGSVAAGGFDVQVKDGTGSLGVAYLDTAFTAWCLDIGRRLALPSSYQVTATPFSPVALTSQQRGDIRRLFNTGYSESSLGTSANGKNYSAGFQLALWEIVNETGAYDLTGGSFSATGFNGAIAVANNLLGNLGNPNPPGNFRIVYLQSQDADGGGMRDSQNLVTVAAVPLPAAGVLLVLALGALGVAGRRRAA